METGTNIDFAAQILNARIIFMNLTLSGESRLKFRFRE